MDLSRKLSHNCIFLPDGVRFTSDGYPSGRISPTLPLEARPSVAPRLGVERQGRELRFSLSCRSRASALVKISAMLSSVPAVDTHLPCIHVLAALGVRQRARASSWGENFQDRWRSSALRAVARQMGVGGICFRSRNSRTSRMKIASLSRRVKREVFGLLLSSRR